MTMSRRRYLVGMTACMPVTQTLYAGVASLPEGLSEASLDAIEAMLDGRELQAGRVRLQIPKLAENGLSVPMVANIESPMSDEDHVRTLHVVAPANPVPTVARVYFGRRAGEAYISTRIRLADTQTVLGFAEMSDGSVWLGSAHVVVTLGGCVDPIL